MGAAVGIVKNTFEKIFNNLSKEIGEPVSNIQLGIYYTPEGSQKYEVYRQYKKEKDIEIGNYVGTLIDWSGGTAVIDATIAQAGAGYAKELGKPIELINIIMQHVKGKLPNAVLMVDGKKERNIDVNDFLG